MPVAMWLCTRVIKQSAFVKHVLGREEGFRQTVIQTVVLLDVALENIRAGPQDTLKPGSIELYTFQEATSNHGGSTGTVHQQSYFTKIV